MNGVIGCACGLDPATETMAAQVGIAIALSAPYWFRDQIREAIRRLRGKDRGPKADPCSDEPDDADHG